MSEKGITFLEEFNAIVRDSDEIALMCSCGARERGDWSLYLIGWIIKHTQIAHLGVVMILDEGPVEKLRTETTSSATNVQREHPGGSAPDASSERGR